MPTFNINRDEEFDIDGAIRHNEAIERREEAEGRPTRTPEATEPPRKCINQVWVDEATWDALIAVANKRGDTIATLSADILADAVDRLTEILESRSFRINRLRNRSREYFDQLAAVESVAMECNLRPSSELSEILVSMCDELGIDPEGLKEKVKGDPMAEEIASFRSNPRTKTAQCKRWMVNLMRQYDYKIKAQQANKLGADSGFTKDMLAQVRRRLNIMSIADGDGSYYWVVNRPANAAASILSGRLDDWENAEE